MTKKTNLSWQIKKLGEVCDFENGDRGSNYPSKSFRTVSGIPFINAGHLEDEGIDFHEMDYISRERYDLLGNGKIKRNDILFCLRGSLGKFACVGELNEGAIASSLVILRTRNSLELKYLLAYLGSQLCADMIRKYCNGAAQPNLSAGSLRKFIIPLPPLPEQKRIVTILDEAFAAIAKAKNNAEKNLQNARELFESYLQNVFAKPREGWEEKKLMQISEIRPPKNEARVKLKDTDTVSFVPMEDLGIKQKWFLPVKERTLKEVEGSYTYFADGDVLLAKITPCFENGKLGIANNLKNGMGFGSSEFIVFRTNKCLTPEFLYYYLLREEFRQEGSKRMMGAVGHKRVSKEFVENSIIPVPSLLDQNRVVAKLDALSAETKKLEAIYQQKLADLEELKKSILQKAFNGELAGVCS